MPLSPPAARRPLHTRRITCQGFQREDGLWDIEGNMTDEKTYSFHNEWRGEVKPGDFIHNMWIRLTIDDSLTVHAVEAVSDHTPFSHCGDITPHYQRLVGLRIGPGWTAAIKERVGRVQGCTHLSELLGPMATTAFQTVATITRPAEPHDPAQPPPRPPVLNTCHAWASDGAPVRRYFPAFYTGPDAIPAPEGGEAVSDDGQDGGGDGRQ